MPPVSMGSVTPDWPRTRAASTLDSDSNNHCGEICSLPWRFSTFRNLFGLMDEEFRPDYRNPMTPRIGIPLRPCRSVPSRNRFRSNEIGRLAFTANSYNAIRNVVTDGPLTNKTILVSDREQRCPKFRNVIRRGLERGYSFRGSSRPYEKYGMDFWNELVTEERRQTLLETVFPFWWNFRIASFVFFLRKSKKLLFGFNASVSSINEIRCRAYKCFNIFLFRQGYLLGERSEHRCLYETALKSTRPYVTRVVSAISLHLRSLLLSLQIETATEPY